MANIEEALATIRLRLEVEEEFAVLCSKNGEGAQASAPGEVPPSDERMTEMRMRRDRFSVGAEGPVKSEQTAALAPGLTPRMGRAISSGSRQ